MPRDLYTKDQVEFLRQGYVLHMIEELTRLFNLQFGTDKTEKAIRSALRNRNFTCGRKVGVPKGTSRLFNAEQVEFIKANYSSMRVGELADALNKTFPLGVSVGQVKSFVNNSQINSGRTGKFEKGQKPWNTGTKGTGVCKPNKGCFKPGDVPKTIRPLGSERICAKDGYVMVKVSEKNPWTGHKTRFKAKHIIVWESHHGPVPKGKVIRFLDGNKLNCDISNLAMISRQEHQLLNKTGFTNMPGEVMPSCIAYARLRVKMFEITKNR